MFTDQDLHNILALIGMADPLKCNPGLGPIREKIEEYFEEKRAEEIEIQHPISESENS